MEKPLKILHLEDNAQDAELVEATLNVEGVCCEISVVDSKAAYVTALDRGGFDLILADYTLLSFDGLSALRIAKEASPTTPFILVSGMMGEEAAIESLKLGATDYVLKNNLVRLVPCIKRAIHEVDDARAHKAAEAQIRLQSAALTAAGNAIVITDRKGCILWVNPAFSKLTGYSSREAIGQNPRLLKSGMHDQRFYRELWNTILSGDIWSGEIINRRSDGTLYTEEQSITPVKTDEGTITHFIAIKQDISERKQAEQALRARDVSEAANRMKTEFLANMSHELRTPLNAIIGFAQLMHDGKVGPISTEHKEYLGDILSSGQHLLQLINDILDNAKVESGRMEVLNTSFTVTDLIVEVTQNLAPIMSLKGLKLVREIPDELPPITSDRRKLLQILLNLASNAVKFTERGEIRLRCDATGSTLRLAVSDTGIGIKEKDLGLLFQPFSQIDSGLKRIHEGTGLGLHLSQNLARLLGGMIAVESEYGKGTTFTLALPLMPETRTPALAKETSREE